MPDGPGGFAQDYTCPALLRMPLGLSSLHIRNCHPLWLNFPDHSIRDKSATARSYNPGEAQMYNSGLGSSPVARHYWGNHCCFLFLEVLRCFSSLGWPPCTSRDNSASRYWVVPFGNPRIKGYLLLPAAYRSLSRPSSPP